MKKNFSHKITPLALVAMLLSCGVGNVWGATGEAEKLRVAALAERAEAARAAHAKATEKLEQTTAKKVGAQERLKQTQAELTTHLEGTKNVISEENQKKITAAKTFGDLEALKTLKTSSPEERAAVDKAIELKRNAGVQTTEIAEHQQTMEEQKAEVAKHAATLKELSDGKSLEAEGKQTVKKPTQKKQPKEEKPAAKTEGAEEKPAAEEGTEAGKKKSTLKSAIDWIKENKGKATFGAIAGVGLALAGIFEELSVASKSAAEFINNFKHDWGIDGGGTPSSNPNIGNPPLPKADPNDEDYNKTLADVVALFTNFDQDLKDMLEKNADYAVKFIQFEAGQVEIDGNQVTVSIRWDMDQLELGMPLTPVLITLSPEDLRGFALTPADILGKMDDGAAKDTLALILKPTASLIFTIKLIQLYNLASKTYPNDDIANIEFMLDETTKLYSRFILSTDEDTLPDSLNSYLQQYPAIVEVLNNKNVKVYKALVDDIETAPKDQKNAFMNIQTPNLQQGPLFDSIKIFYNHFYQIYYKKFQNDAGYTASTFTPGVRATKNMLQAIFYRGLKDVMQAVQELSTADGQVTLRNLDGTTSTVTPKTYLNTLITNPSESLATATNTLKSAVTGIKKIIDAAKAAKAAVQPTDMQGAKDAYEKAINGVKTASGAASDALLKFRKKFAPYYPLTWDDGTSLTPAEFMVANIKNLNDADPTNVKNLISKIYAPFSKEMGLTVAQLLPQPSGSAQGSGGTQGTLASKVTGFVTGAVKSLGTSTTKPATTTPATPASTPAV